MESSEAKIGPLVVAISESWETHLPDPNSPTNSVMAWVSTPPPSSLLTLFEPVVSLSSPCLRSQRSLAFMKSNCIDWRAALMTFRATLDSRFALSATSRTGATANASTESKPASVSFPAVIGPTPSRSRMLSTFSISSTLSGLLTFSASRFSLLCHLSPFSLLPSQKLSR